MSSSRAQTIRQCFAAYETKDRAVVEALLTQDFTFTSPYDDAIDRAAYFERCWPNSERVTRIDVERVFEQGDEAFATYLFTGKDGKQFRNTEFFTFDGDRIRSVHVYFGESYRDRKFVRQQT